MSGDDERNGKKAHDDRLKAIPSGGDEEPEIYCITAEAGTFELTRRGFLVALAGVTLAGLTTGCGAVRKTKRIRQMGPKTFTLPCGTPTPPDAVCVCDCVSGSRSGRYNTEMICTCDTIDVPVGSGHAGSICTCDLICTCNTISTPSYRGGGGTRYISYWHPN